MFWYILDQSQTFGSIQLINQTSLIGARLSIFGFDFLPFLLGLGPGLPIQILAWGDRGPMGGICTKFATKSGGVTNMIKGKNGYLVLSLIKKLLSYPNLSSKYVLFVKNFEHK